MYNLKSPPLAGSSIPVTRPKRPSFALACDHLPRRFVLLPHDLAHQKQVGEQRSEMDGSVQIVNQLGADGGLGQDQLNGGERIASVAIEHCQERQIFVGRLKTFLFDRHSTSFRQPGQGFHGALQELTDLSTRFTALVTGETLGCVGQHELVALFHSITTIADLSQHRLTLDLLLGWMSMVKKLVKKMSRPPIDWDRVLSNKNRGSSSQRSSIS